MILTETGADVPIGSKLRKNSSEHMFRLKNLPKSVPDYLDTLRAWGLLATIKASEPFDQFV
jgi:hypothetical protein